MSEEAAELLDEVNAGLDYSDDDAADLISMLDCVMATMREFRAAAYERRDLDLPAPRDPGPSQEQRL